MSIVYILAAILIFGILIAVHELGHFLAAKFCGVQVNEFSIGMGPALWKRQKGETLYSLRLLPIGGYCAMEGEDEDTGNTRSFVRQGFLKKLVILAAGAFMNFIAGLLIIAILFSSAQVFWVDSIANLAPEVTQTGASGLMPGDQIYKVNGWRTYFSGDAQMFWAIPAIRPILRSFGTASISRCRNFSGRPVRTSRASPIRALDCMWDVRRSLRPRGTSFRIVGIRRRTLFSWFGSVSYNSFREMPD